MFPIFLHYTYIGSVSNDCVNFRDPGADGARSALSNRGGGGVGGADSEGGGGTVGCAENFRCETDGAGAFSSPEADVVVLVGEVRTAQRCCQGQGGCRGGVPVKTGYRS